MIKQRIQVYADPETKRRIELAAAKHQMPVTEYCFEAIRQQLSEDDVLEREHIEIPIKPNNNNQWIADLRRLREKILTRRQGQLMDVAEAIEQMREERDHELTGLR